MYCKLLSFIYIFAKQKQIDMKIYSLIITALISFSAMAGNGDSEKIYKILKSETDVFSMSLSKTMIDFFDMDVDFKGTEKWITGDFEEGRMMVIKEKFTGSDIQKIFKTEGFELIDLEEDEDINLENGEVHLYVTRKKDKVSEAHFIIEGDEKIVLFSIYGDMKVSEKN